MGKAVMLMVGFLRQTRHWSDRRNGQEWGLGLADRRSWAFHVTTSAPSLPSLQHWSVQAGKGNKSPHTQIRLMAWPSHGDLNAPLLRSFGDILDTCWIPDWAVLWDLLLYGSCCPVSQLDHCLHPASGKGRRARAGSDRHSVRLAPLHTLTASSLTALVPSVHQRSVEPSVQLALDCWQKLKTFKLWAYNVP